MSVTAESTFNASEILARPMYQRITDMRIKDPECAFRNAQNRKKRAEFSPDGRLSILAVDHPARRVTKVGDNPLAMADRYDYLTRIIAILQAKAVDGVMASMDILEELLILHELLGNINKPGLLDEMLLIPSLNRGGLSGTAWELDDPMTGTSAENCKLWGFDGAKMLMRLCDDNSDSLKTLTACSDQVTYLNELELPVFLEPLPVEKTAEGYKVIKTPQALAQIVGVASALGDSSRNMWLKLPYCDNFATVANATTLPIVLLGGEVTKDIGEVGTITDRIRQAMQNGWNVRGVMIGRNVMYPANNGSPVEMAKEIYGLVHPPQPQV